jgi:hypothetical protein
VRLKKGRTQLFPLNTHRRGLLAEKPGPEIVSGPGYIPPADLTPVAPVPAIYYPCVLFGTQGWFFLPGTQSLACPHSRALSQPKDMPPPPDLVDETSNQHRSASLSLGLGPTPPHSPKQLTVPSQYGVWLHDYQRIFPRSQLARQQHEQRTVAPGKFQTLCLPFEHDQLLAQESVFQHQF